MWNSIVLALGWVWYVWRVCTLTMNWASFPDPNSARAIWQRRSNFSLWLSASVLNDTLYALGLIARWWVIVVSLLGCFLVMSFVQPLLIVVATVLIMRIRMWKISRGKDPDNSFIGELVVWQYLTPAERAVNKQRILKEKHDG